METKDEVIQPRGILMTSNRTSLEWKLYLMEDTSRETVPSNRTSLEWKRVL